MTPELHLAARLGLALGMALFMGLAFEGVYKRDVRTSPGGIRTFPLLALVGSLLYQLSPSSPLPFTVGLAAVGAWLYAHQRAEARAALAPSSGSDSTATASLVVPTANLLAYCLGPISLTQPAWVCVAATVIAVLLLESRAALHRLVFQVPADEVFTLGKFLILVGIILPLLPNHPVVPWTPITPFQVWLALVAISSLSYASYLLQRYLPSSGALWPAVLGGAYSSTATTVALAREQSQLGAPRGDLAAGIIVATAVMYLRIEVIVAIFNAPLAVLLAPALLGQCVLAVLVAVWLWYSSEKGAASSTSLPAVNPLQLGTAATFAVLFVLLALASNWMRDSFGREGVYALSLLTGLTDVAPFIINLAQGGVTDMSLRAIGAAVLLSAASNNVVKGFYALSFGGRRACLRPAIALLALGLIGLLVPLAYVR